MLVCRYISLMTVAISLVSCLRASDLYAIGLAPNGKGTQDAYLYRVDRVGHKLDAVRDISSNPDFVFVDLERSIVVAAAPSGLPTQVSILDTRSPDETREVAFSYKEGGLSYAAVEVDVPAKMLILGFCHWAARTTTTGEIRYGPDTYRRMSQCWERRGGINSALSARVSTSHGLGGRSFSRVGETGA